MRVIRAFACALLVASPAFGQSKPVAAVAKPGGGQRALAVGFDRAGGLRAKVCAALPCSVENGRELLVPSELRPRLGATRLTVVPVGKGRRAIVVTVPDPAKQRAWEAVLAAPIGGDRPKVVFEGLTGLAEGEYGVRHGGMVMISEARADGSRSIVVGEQREDLTLCGRPAVLAPTLLWPDDLTLKPAKVQRLTPSERSGAPELTATRAEAETGTRYPLLRAIAATSAIGSPAALTDGDPDTTWSENRGGSGRGEFVLMQAPPALPLTALEIVVKPPKAVVEGAVAPKELWFATPDRVLSVVLPDAAAKEPGARWVVELKEPLRTDCLALITESAFGGDARSRVTIAEVSARTEFDASTVDGLVGALAGGGKRAEAAGSALAALGPPGVEAIAKAWDRLDEGGRRVALDVVDHAPCGLRAPIYLRALLGPHAAQRIHARERLRSCGAESAPAIEAAIAAQSRRAHPLLVNELALVAPERAVKLAVPLLGRADRRGRQLLRVALGRAVRRDSAHAAVREQLKDQALPEVAKIDLLRSLGDGITGFQPEAGEALARLTAEKAAFRTRYLLLEPAARLAAVDARARGWVARSLASDPSPFVRLHAAEVISSPQAFERELVRAVNDPEVRVREAALRSLAKPTASFAGQHAAHRLRTDKWPLVRMAAADALAQMRADPALDAALGAALGDASYHVRASVIAALGERRARRYAPALRERLEDDKEVTEVRGSAALALGLMCDRESTEELTRHARSLADPMLDNEARAIATVALGALSRIHPPDLKERLAPLLGKETSPFARHAAQAALRSRGSCGRVK